MRSRQQGLTLIELLVAIGVLAFVAVLGWRGLDAITRARAALMQPASPAPQAAQAWPSPAQAAGSSNGGATSSGSSVAPNTQTSLPVPPR